MRRDPNLYFEVGDAVARFDSTPWLASLEMPTMVIVNIEDQLMPSQAQYELASFFDDDVVELRGARHESIMNRGPDYVKLIDEFADRSRRCACRG